MNRLNERQKQVVQLHLKNGLPKYKAYMQVYGVNEETARSSSARMFANDSVISEVETVRQTIVADADWAYQELKTMVQDKKTPANVKEKILNTILSRAALDAPQKIETKTEPIFPGLNDPKSRVELIEQALRSAKAQVEG